MKLTNAQQKKKQLVRFLATVPAGKHLDKKELAEVADALMSDEHGPSWEWSKDTENFVEGIMFDWGYSKEEAERICKILGS